MEQMDPEARTFVGRWQSYEKTQLYDGHDWKIDTTLLLKPNGTYSYLEIEEACSYGQHSIKTVTKRGKGHWNFCGGIFLRGELYTKSRCACGGARSSLQQSNFVASYPTVQKWEAKFKRPYEKSCWFCHKPGHYALSCPEIVCFACNQKGHKAKNCPHPTTQQEDNVHCCDDK